MKIYIYIDGSDIEDIAEALTATFTEWVGPPNEKLYFVNQRHELAPGASVTALPTWEFGINMTLKSKVELKDPLAFLYGIAKQYKRDFVIGIFDAKTGEPEDVCYFGDEEGRPDLYEIGNYLDL